MFGRETPVEVEFDQIENYKTILFKFTKTHLNRFKKDIH